MSETKMITIPKITRDKLKDISKKFDRLNTGNTEDTFWLAGASTGGYEWSQIDFGITKSGQFVSCTQSGCSCYGPEQPTADGTHELDETLQFEESDYDPHVEDAVTELKQTTNTIYKVLNDKKVTPKEVIELPNAEVRRAVIEIVGYDKLTKHALIKDESEVDGRLMVIKLPEDEDLTLLHVKDPSTTREYFLRVPPKMKTAREARAWTFGFEAEDFEMDKET